MLADVAMCFCRARDALSLLEHCNCVHIYQGKRWLGLLGLKCFIRRIVWVDKFADGSSEGSFKQEE